MRLSRVRLRSALFKNNLRRPHFSIAEIMGLVAAVAVVRVWPQFLFHTIFLFLVWLLCKVGLSLVLSCLLVLAILSLGLPILMRPVVTH